MPIYKVSLHFQVKDPPQPLVSAMRTESEESGAIDTWIIIVISVVALVVLVLLIAALLYWWCKSPVLEYGIPVEDSEFAYEGVSLMISEFEINNTAQNIFFV